MTCELCTTIGGELLWRSELVRVVLVADARFPGFCRVILNDHAREMTDLPRAAQTEVLRVTLATEQAVRDVQRPDKVNLASLGNVTPHVHWHVIPRWHDDSHFPDPIWAAARRPGAARATVDAAALRDALRNALEHT